MESVFSTLHSQKQVLSVDPALTDPTWANNQSAKFKVEDLYFPKESPPVSSKITVSGTRESPHLANFESLLSLSKSIL